MPSLAEIRRAFYGAWRLLVLDAKGLSYFQGDRKGALRSFWVLAIVLPLAILAGLIPEPVVADTPVTPHNATVDLVGFVLRWLALLLVTFGLVRWYGRKERFGLFVSAYNWTQILQSLVTILYLALYSGASHVIDLNAVETASAPLALLGSLVVAAVVGLQVLMLAYEWFVAWVSLDSGIALPTIVVLLDLVSDLALAKISAALA